MTGFTRLTEVHDLKKSFSLDPSFKEYAKKDPDLKSLWEDEEFKKLVL